MKYIVVALAILGFSGQAYAVRDTHDDPNVPEPNVYNATPIVPSLIYDPAIVSPPAVNPSPNPILPGQEVTQLAYVSAAGELYDIQVNLTASRMKILKGSVVVYSGVLTPQEVENFRLSPAMIQAGTAVAGFVGGLLTTIVEGAINYVSGADASATACTNGYTSALRSAAQQMQHCRAMGKTPEIYGLGSRSGCGMGVVVTCN
jgi:hypothetical protein